MSFISTNYAYAQIFKEIVDSGAKVIIAGSMVGGLALHLLGRLGFAVLKILSKFDLHRLCRAVNAGSLTRMDPPTPEEAGYAATRVQVPYAEGNAAEV